MTYGYRLNVEDIFFRMADEAFRIATATMSDAEDFDPAGNMCKVRAPIVDEAISNAVLAIVGWAVGFESFVNLTWRLRVGTDLPTKDLLEHTLRTMGTVEKAKYLFHRDHERGKRPEWVPALERLFGFRNTFVHFKDGTKFIGHSFEPPELLALRQSVLEEMRAALIQAVRDLAPGQPFMRTAFLRGTYRVLEADGAEDLEEEYLEDEWTRYVPDDSESNRSEPHAESFPSAQCLAEELKEHPILVLDELRGIVLRIPAENLFKMGHASLRQEAKGVLGALARVLLARCPNTGLLVEGHTDVLGSRSAHRRFSEERAENVRIALIRAGFRPTNVEARGIGSDWPVAKDDSPDGRSANRRIDIVLRG